jgi:hypothetical protein
MTFAVGDDAVFLLRWRTERALQTGRAWLALEILEACARTYDLTAPIEVVDNFSPRTLTLGPAGDIKSPAWDIISTD